MILIDQTLSWRKWTWIAITLLLQKIALRRALNLKWEEYEKDKYISLPSESKEYHSTFQVDGVRFTWAKYDKRKPGLFKVETSKDKMISLCSKLYCASDITEEKIKFSCKGIYRKMGRI